MKELTKEQKLEVVKYAYEKWKGGGYSKFMCVNLKYGLGDLLSVYMRGSEDVPLYIPELLNYKPKLLYGKTVWWNAEDGMEARDKAFQGLIKELSPNKDRETFWNKIVKFFKGLF
jgi:hypothetical protein